MEEVDVNDDAAYKEGDSRQRRKMKKKATLQRQRSESEIREELGLPELGGMGHAAGVVAIVFASMAAIGGAMQLMSNSNNQTLANQVQAQQKLDVSVTYEVFIAACETTWMATKLWTRLLWAILLPTSHQTFRITKDGFSAMQPSIRASIQLLLDLHWTTKLIIGGVILALVAAFMLQREIRRRRYRERFAAFVERRYTAVQSVYDGFAESVSQQSRLLADALPHLLFAAGAGAIFVLGRDQFAEFSRGLGGWVVVIGLPVVLATRALIVYDMAYREKIERYHGQRRRTFSQLPTPEMAQRREFRVTSYLSSWLPGSWSGEGPRGRNRHSTRRSPGSGGDQDSEDDTSSIGSLDSQDISTVVGIHYPRQLEMDPEASLEQYEELQSVIYWVQYWTVLGVALLFEQMPLSGHLLSALPLWPPARLMWSLWLQMPGTSGAQLAFRQVIPLVDRLIGKVDGPTVSTAQQNLLVNVLLAFRIISPSTRDKLSEVMETGSTLVIAGLVLFVMPSTITAIGAIAIGIGRPVLAASRALLAIERAEKITRMAATTQDAASLKRFRSNSVSITNGAVQTTQWLEYWVVYTLCMLAHGVLSIGLFWFPLWNHMLLAFTLWLQLPYFRGAHNIFKFVLQVFYKVRPYFVKEEDSRQSVARPPSSGLDISTTLGGSPLSAIDEVASEDGVSEQSLSRRSSKRSSRRSSRSSSSRDSPISPGSSGSETKRQSSRRSSRSSTRSSRSSRSSRSRHDNAAGKHDDEPESWSWFGLFFGGGAVQDDAIKEETKAEADDHTGDDDPSVDDGSLDESDDVMGDAVDFERARRGGAGGDDSSSVAQSDLGSFDRDGPNEDDADDASRSQTPRSSRKRQSSRNSSKKKRRSSARSRTSEAVSTGPDDCEDKPANRGGFFASWW